MTNGEKIIAILTPREDQIKIYGDWVEIEIQSSAINFGCSLEWWNSKYKEPTRKPCKLCKNYGSHNGVCDTCNPKYNDLWKEKELTIQERQAEWDRFNAAFQDGYDVGYAWARFNYESEK
jgi:hypothetical protein